MGEQTYNYEVLKYMADHIETAVGKDLSEHKKFGSFIKFLDENNLKTKKMLFDFIIKYELNGKRGVVTIYDSLGKEDAIKSARIKFGSGISVVFIKTKIKENV